MTSKEKITNLDKQPKDKKNADLTVAIPVTEVSMGDQNEISNQTQRRERKSPSETILMTLALLLFVNAIVIIIYSKVLAKNDCKCDECNLTGPPEYPVMEHPENEVFLWGSGDGIPEQDLEHPDDEVFRWGSGDGIPEQDFSVDEWDPNDPNDGRYPVPENTCGIQEYRTVRIPSCSVVVDNPDHPNSFWDNDKFLCRFDERPCSWVLDRNLAQPSRLILHDKTIDIKRSYEADPTEVGIMLGNNDMRTACYEFWSENHWYYMGDLSLLAGGSSHCFGRRNENGVACEEFGEYPPDVNDYAFGSLKCCEGTEVSIIIDGVLVDACPRTLAESCRDCEIYY